MSIQSVNKTTTASWEEITETYSFQSTVNKIGQLSLENRIGLFIGREPEESLPVNDNTIWVANNLTTYKTLEASKLYL